MPATRKEPKMILPAYLKVSKITKVKRYALNKKMKGPSAVIDKALDLLFQTYP